MKDPVEWLDDSGWFTNRLGFRARLCPETGKECACVLTECHITESNRNEFTDAVLSIDERIRLSGEIGLLEFVEFCAWPVGPICPGQIIRHKGLYYECIYDSHVTALLDYAPGTAKGATIWGYVPSLNDLSVIPKVPKMSARAKRYIAACAKINKKFGVKP